MATPDITRAQVVAVAQAVIACLVAFGTPIDETQAAALVTLSGVIAVGLFGSDAHIRNGRARAAAAGKALKAVQQPTWASSAGAAVTTSSVSSGWTWDTLPTATAVEPDTPEPADAERFRKGGFPPVPDDDTAGRLGEPSDDCEPDNGAI